MGIQQLQHEGALFQGILIHVQSKATIYVAIRVHSKGIIQRLAVIWR